MQRYGLSKNRTCGVSSSNLMCKEKNSFQESATLRGTTGGLKESVETGPASRRLSRSSIPERTFVLARGRTAAADAPGQSPETAPGTPGQSPATAPPAADAPDQLPDTARAGPVAGHSASRGRRSGPVARRSAAGPADTDAAAGALRPPQRRPRSTRRAGPVARNSADRGRRAGPVAPESCASLLRAVAGRPPADSEAGR